MTCHDGFSLYDLVSYERKHNDANGEMGRDGSDDNLSWNCGTEGPTSEPAVLVLREQQVRNFLCLLFLSHGTPMLLMGDESGHTRQGNNNPWCQDNELNWLDWDQVRRNTDLVRFAGKLVRFTESLEILQENRFWAATNPELKGDISWHGEKPGRPDWTTSSRILAFTLEQPASGHHVHAMLNAGDKEVDFTLPEPPAGRVWARILDTSRILTDDTPEFTPIPLPEASMVQVQGHTITVLQCRDKLLK